MSRKPDTDDSNKPEPAKPGACTAYGCCLPGVFSGSFSGHGDGWWCYVHARSNCDLQATTDEIRHRAPLFRALLRASCHRDWSKWATVSDFFQRSGRSDLAPTEEEHSDIKRLGTWIRRVREKLADECFVRSDSDREAFEPRPNGPQSMSSLARSASSAVERATQPEEVEA